jgi:SulP family sulfate permease
VQDVGLIFLSAMATDIASICNGAGLPANEALGTVLFTFSVATMIVGILTMLVGESLLIMSNSFPFIKVIIPA